jgi:hypothetical protein
MTRIVDKVLTRGYRTSKHSLAGKEPLLYMGNLLRKRSIFGLYILFTTMPIKALLGLSCIFAETVS